MVEAFEANVLDVLTRLHGGRFSRLTNGAVARAIAGPFVFGDGEITGAVALDERVAGASAGRNKNKKRQ
ncbi:MAG: hypothetical protein HYY84_15305 [Deltaproteobacteria bacterium]|nr:hypothetical protein [Deltaproteobacteria bacterium]